MPVRRWIAPEWKLIRRSLVDRPPLQGLLLRGAFVRHAVACANQAPRDSTRRREALAEARAHLRRFPRCAVPVVTQCAQLFDALIAEAEGHPEHAIAQYHAALPGLDEHDAQLFAHVARDRLGRLVGGDEGAALCVEARSWLDAESVRDPNAMLAMILPS